MFFLFLKRVSISKSKEGRFQLRKIPKSRDWSVAKGQREGEEERGKKVEN